MSGYAETEITYSRRNFLTLTGAGLVALGTLGRDAAAAPAPRRRARVAMTDWNLGRSADVEAVERAAEAGLMGVQVSIGTAPDSIPLRDPAVRQRYLEAGRRLGISFPSTAAGSILNRYPLKSEPQSAVYVIDAVEAAAALGAGCVLVAFFSEGDLRLRDAGGRLRDISDGPFSVYELDTRGVTRVVEAMRQIAPWAEDAGVILGLENTLTAEQNLEIIERIGSPAVQVYYDVGNSTAYGYDVPAEIRLLGRDRICEIHIKETLGLDQPEWGLLGGLPEGGVDFAAAAAAIRDIGYDGWFVLETSGRQNRFLEDTRANIAFVERLMA